MQGRAEKCGRETESPLRAFLDLIGGRSPEDVCRCQAAASERLRLSTFSAFFTRSAFRSLIISFPPIQTSSLVRPIGEHFSIDQPSARQQSFSYRILHTISVSAMHCDS